MDAQTQYEDVVRRASSILTSHKRHTLHTAGLTIVSEKRIEKLEQRLAAFERLAEAVKEYTADYGHTPGNMFYHSESAPAGSAEKMYKALEAIERGNP